MLQDAPRHQVPAEPGGFSRGSAPGAGLGARSVVPSEQREVCALRKWLAALLPDAAAGFPVPFGDDSAVTQLCLFTAAKKSCSKQNPQAPAETCLRREFSCQSIDWCFAERRVLKPRTLSNSIHNLLKSRRKWESLVLRIPEMFCESEVSERVCPKTWSSTPFRVVQLTTPARGTGMSKAEPIHPTSPPTETPEEKKQIKIRD